MKKFICAWTIALIGNAVWAKLPAPVLTDEAKSKAAEATAKTAHGNKIANFQLCKSMDRTAAHYVKTVKATGKELKPATATPVCDDPGAFVFPPPAAAAVPVAAAPASVAAVQTAKPATAAAAVAPAKK